MRAENSLDRSGGRKETAARMSRRVAQALALLGRIEATLRRSVAVAALAALAAALGMLGAIWTPPAGSATAALDAEEQAFLQMINDYRAQNGVGPLALNGQLTDAADWMSHDMASKGYWPDSSYCAQFGISSHCDSLGRTYIERILSFGNDLFAALGENIAGGVFPTAQSAFTAWKGSPGHNANMLSSRYNVIGIGRAYGSGGWFWTTDFGWLAASATPTPSPSVSPPLATPTPIPTPSPTYTASPSPTATPSPSPTPSPAPVHGDANCDRLVGSVDALAVLRWAAGLAAEAACLDQADANCDGALHAVDALLILRFVAGLPNALPEGCPQVGSGL